jgi:tryptophan synthase beta chain
MAPLVSHAVHEGLIEATALHQSECFEAGLEFARTQGIVAAPESAHALAQARREALAAKESGEEKVILFNLCGHGHFDMAAYQAYFNGELVDYEYPQERIAAAMERVPVVAGA